jgi:hypothetical protein
MKLQQVTGIHNIFKLLTRPCSYPG